MAAVRIVQLGLASLATSVFLLGASPAYSDACSGALGDAEYLQAAVQAYISDLSNGLRFQKIENERALEFEQQCKDRADASPQCASLARSVETASGLRKEKEQSVREATQKLDYYRQEYQKANLQLDRCRRDNPAPAVREASPNHLKDLEERERLFKPPAVAELPPYDPNVDLRAPNKIGDIGVRGPRRSRELTGGRIVPSDLVPPSDDEKPPQRITTLTDLPSPDDMTPEQRERVREALNAGDKPPQRITTLQGLPSPDDMTPEQRERVREALNAADKPPQRITTLQGLPSPDDMTPEQREKLRKALGEATDAGTHEASTPDDNPIPRNVPAADGESQTPDDRPNTPTRTRQPRPPAPPTDRTAKNPPPPPPAIGGFPPGTDIDIAGLIDTPPVINPPLNGGRPPMTGGDSPPPTPPGPPPMTGGHPPPPLMGGTQPKPPATPPDKGKQASIPPKTPTPATPAPTDDYRTHSLSQPFTPGGQCPNNSAFEVCNFGPKNTAGKTANAWVGCVDERDENFVCKSSNAPPNCSCKQDRTGKVPPRDQLVAMAPKPKTATPPPGPALTQPDPKLTKPTPATGLHAGISVLPPVELPPPSMSSPPIAPPGPLPPAVLPPPVISAANPVPNHPPPPKLAAPLPPVPLPPPIKHVNRVDPPTPPPDGQGSSGGQQESDGPRCAWPDGTVKAKDSSNVNQKIVVKRDTQCRSRWRPGKGTTHLAIGLKSPARNGTVTTEGVALIYKPRAGFTGSDRFVISVQWTNSKGNRNGTATYNVTVQ